MSNKNNNFRKYLNIGLMIASGVTATIIWLYIIHKKDEQMSFSDFMENVKNGKITQVNIYENYLVASCVMRLTDNPQEFYIKHYKVQFHPNSMKFVDELRSKNVAITFSHIKTNPILRAILGIITQCIMLFLTLYILRSSMNPDLDQTTIEGGNDDKTPELYQVVGFSTMKEEILKILKYWTRIINDDNYNQDFLLTILFKGAPGTGKTFMANVIAKTTQAKFLKIDLSSVGSPFIHQTSRNIQKIFDKARDLAKDGNNVIIFMDELDAVLESRSSREIGMSNKENTEVVTTILKNLSGLRGPWEKKIMVIGGTNHDTNLDPAFQSRVSSTLEFTNPNAKDRYELINFYIKNEFKNVDFVKDLDIIIDLTEGQSHRGIKTLLLNASIKAQYEGTTIKEKPQVTLDHIFESLISKEKSQEYWVSNDTRMSISMHEAGHGILGHYLYYNNFSPLAVKAIGMTIGKSKNTGGVTFFGVGKCSPIEEEEIYMSLTNNKMYSLSHCMVCLGGKIGEMYYFSLNKNAPDTVVGWSGDMQQIVNDLSRLYFFGVDILEIKSIFKKILMSIPIKNLTVKLQNKAHLDYLTINDEKSNKLKLHKQPAFEESISINYNSEELDQLLIDMGNKPITYLSFDDKILPMIPFNFKSLVKEYLNRSKQTVDNEKIEFFVQTIQWAWFTSNLIIGRDINTMEKLAYYCKDRLISCDDEFFQLLNQFIKKN